MRAKRITKPTAAAFQATLQQHAIDVWYPRSLDLKDGGFLCDFNRAWKPCGPHAKLLEFQARQTMFAAEANQVYPHDTRLAEATRHGYHYLCEAMWDAEDGGWYHRLDRAGRPTQAYTKHTHGIAYAIHACAAVYQATGDAGALALAKNGFEWLDRHAHNADYNGYFGFLTRDGAAIRDAADCPWETEIDTIDTPIGLQDLNVHSDLLEALTVLYSVAPTPQLQERIAEIVELICAKALAPSGALAYFFQPDWRPIPHLVRFGTEFQTIYRLIDAGKLLGIADQTTPVARRVMHHALKFGWDARGGFFFAGPATAPMQLEGHCTIARRKSWWVQVEALRALLALMQEDPADPTFANYFAAQWEFIRHNLLDTKYGGMYATGNDHLPRWRRKLGASFSPREWTRKGTEWKDASHDGRTWLYCLAHLDRVNLDST